jgi:hypothetical protein
LRTAWVSPASFAFVSLSQTRAALAGLGYFYNGLAWDAFPLSEGENRMQAWFQALWPDSFNVENNFHNALKAESD